MHATIRSYTDSSVADLLEQNREDVEALMGAVPGVHSYVFVRTAAGGTSVTVGESETATSESSKTAADYLRSKGVTADPPTVTGGEVLAHVGAGVDA